LNENGKDTEAEVENWKDNELVKSITDG